MTQTITAQDVFRSAYENRYTWDKNFPGYKATVTMKSGDEQHTAQVTVKSDLSFEVSDIEDKEAKKSIQGQLWEMTIHRVKHSFEETHGKNTFSFGDKDETGAVEILVGGASAGNSYKVKDDTVSFVNRRIRDKVVNINTLKTLMTESGYLSEKYESFYLNPETKERATGVTTFEDKFEKIGNYYLLVNREIQTTDNDGQPQTIEFNFSDLQLFE
ncbi:conserved hypothetical protein [Hyella patelloides LEGE 07179]|uniref:DUF3386 domain-containing protein n=1 Tax=Hyella patelloides LEGE 07179 TaxID=945734 RepID=A0A563W3D8_9CYAN|nr:DUF3386 domain-containing protein [Hyella patelloides]VEP18137.1 conserved hypothetical protein [Hyella patelloides LEGE 07179]